MSAYHRSAEYIIAFVGIFLNCHDEMVMRVKANNEAQDMPSLIRRVIPMFHGNWGGSLLAIGSARKELLLFKLTNLVCKSVRTFLQICRPEIFLINLGSSTKFPYKSMHFYDGKVKCTSFSNQNIHSQYRWQRGTTYANREQLMVSTGGKEDSQDSYIYMILKTDFCGLRMFQIVFWTCLIHFFSVKMWNLQSAGIPWIMFRQNSLYIFARLKRNVFHTVDLKSGQLKRG